MHLTQTHTSGQFPPFLFPLSLKIIVVPASMYFLRIHVIRGLVFLSTMLATVGCFIDESFELFMSTSVLMSYNVLSKLYSILQDGWCQTKNMY